MSAEVISLASRRPAPPANPLLQPGDEVWIVCHDWTTGENRIRAVVERQNGEWIAAKVAGAGRYSVHVSAVERLDPRLGPEAA